MDCLIDERPESDTPAIFKGEPWCSDVCRKKYEGEIPLQPKDLITLDRSLLGWVVEIGQHAYLRDPGMGEVKSGDDKVITTFPFAHDKTEKAGDWVLSILERRPRFHRHAGSLIHYPVVNVTQAGDEAVVYRCIECGAERVGAFTNENRDEE